MTPLQAGSDLPRSEGPTFDRALPLMRFLRANCSWDAGQTPTSLVAYLLEEAHEVADAVNHGDDTALKDELGDLLLHLAFQTILAEERTAFSAEDVIAGLEDKMRRRHPHLHGEGPAQDWESLKRQERADASLLAGIPVRLDALSRAHRIQERVSTVGFDWPHAADALEKVKEELEEVRFALRTSAAATLEEELGDLLFAAVNLTRLCNVHAMHALQRANAKFIARFESLERLARERGIVLEKCGLEVLDRLWNEVKAEAKADTEEST